MAAARSGRVKATPDVARVLRRGRGRGGEGEGALALRFNQ